MKYVVFDNGLSDVPMVFPGIEKHSDIALRFNWPVLSGGFVRVVNDQVVCYGESISLNVKSRPEEDARLIQQFLMPE